MKKTLFIAVLFISTLGFAQQHFVESHIDGATVFIPNPEPMVYEVVGTADAIYTAVELAIGDTWKNPDEVIDGSSEGSYIKVDGQVGAIRSKTMGMKFSNKSKMAITIRVKDNKFRVEYSSMEVWVDRSQYIAAGWYDRSGIYYKKKNNKMYPFAQENLDSHNLFLDGFIEAIINNVGAEGSANDW